jgi:hypothetical protein
MGEDVIVHVRTTRKFDFSYISGVSMKVGDKNVFEITPNAVIYLNGAILSSGMDTSTLSGLSFILTKEEKGTKKLIVSYSFDFGNRRIIEIQANTKRGMMFVKTKGRFPSETTGMLGSPGKSYVVTRDGRKFDEIDVNQYGESWQVKDTDDQLFKELLGPQYPQKCMYEDAPFATGQLRGRRKLMNKVVISLDDAKSACAHVSSDVKRKLCVEDTIAMGDLEMKDDPFYLEE